MRNCLLLLAALGICSGLCAQKPVWQRAPSHTTLLVWPRGAPGTPPHPGSEIDTTTLPPLTHRCEFDIPLPNAEPTFLRRYVPDVQRVV
jgi:hypothetical protein